MKASASIAPVQKIEFGPDGRHSLAISSGKKQMFFETNELVRANNIVTNVVWQPAAHAQYICVCGPEAPNDLSYQRTFKISPGAQAEIVAFYFGSHNVGCQTRIVIAGQARVRYSVFFFGTQDQVMSFTDQFVFEQPDSFGRFTAHGLVAEKAHGQYQGNIIIQPGAHLTDSRLEAHALIFGPQAGCNMVPQLQIEANNVKAGHAATVSKIDADQLFYLRSRGLSHQQSTQLCIEGIFLDGLSTIENQSIRDYIFTAVRDKYTHLR